MNEFGRTQLEKYGWKAGSGLGKQEDGITKAIKPSLKFDKHGVGHNSSEQFTSCWWDRTFNKTAKSIEVVNSEDKVEVKKRGNDAIELPAKKSKISPDVKNKLIYGSFIKTGTLTGSGEMVSCENNSEALSSDEEFSSRHTDEEIFKKCSGRTAHRGARHGLKMNGKLMRIMKQEQEALCAKVSNAFHKRGEENEKHSKDTGSRQSIKKHKAGQKASEHTKHSIVSTVQNLSSTFGHLSEVASKIKKKKSKHT